MKKYLVLITVVLLAGIVWLVVYQSPKDHVLRESVSAVGRNADSIPTNQSSYDENVPDKGRSKGLAGMERAAPVLPLYACSDESTCDHLIAGAQTEEEAQWLAKRGYPSPVTLASLEGLGIDELKRKASNGDLVAGSIVGMRLIETGHADQGLVTLHQASVNGSVYASYGFAEAYAKDARLKNPLESAAYYRLAYLQGDWKAAAEMTRAFPDMGPMERAFADRRAMRLYEGLNERKRLDKKPIILWLRPTSKD